MLQEEKSSASGTSRRGARIISAGFLAVSLVSLTMFLTDPPSGGTNSATLSQEPPHPTSIPSSDPPALSNSAQAPQAEAPTRAEEKTPPKARQTAKATLRGRVTRHDGTPASGAHLTLRRTLHGKGLAERLGISPHRGTAIASLDTATADADGRFAFLDLPPGRGYQVAAQGEWSAGLSTPVRLFPGRDESVHLIVLPAGRVIGMVRDPNGYPVRDATVDLTTTGADGRFDLGYRSAGNPSLRIGPPQQEAFVYPISVIAGEITELEIGVPGDRGFKGFVHDPDGRPIPAATLRISTDTTIDPSLAAHNLIQTTSVTTNQDGLYRARSTEPQNVRKIQIEAIGYESFEHHGLVGREWNATLKPKHIIDLSTYGIGGKPLSVKSISVHDANGDQRRVLSWMRLDEPGRYRVGVPRPGQFVVKAIAPRHIPSQTEVVIPSSAAVTRVEVSFALGTQLDVVVVGQKNRPAATRWVDVVLTSDGMAKHSGQTGANGHVLFSGLVPGEYTVGVRNQPVTVTPVNVLAGQDHESLRLTLPPTGNLTIHPKARAGASIPLRFKIAGPQRREGWSHAGEPVHFDQLIPGSYKLVVDGPNYHFSNVALDVELRKSDGEVGGPLVVEAQTSSDYELLFDGLAPGSLRYLVVADGKPISNARVNLIRYAENASMGYHHTSADGSLTLNRIAHGEYSALVTFPEIGGPLAGGRFTISPGAQVARQLVIRTGPIEGQVLRLTDGSPVEGARIALISTDRGAETYFNNSNQLATTDAEGHFSIQRVPVQSYSVEASLGDSSTRMRATPGNSPLELRL